MIKKFDFDKKKTVDFGQPLPAGGYVAKILKSEVETNDYGQKIKLSFDIVEGDYEGYFEKKFEAQQSYGEAKWKGTYRLTIPDCDNKWYESQKRTFGNAIWCFEDSNDGYVWDWKEKSLEGKLIGVLFRDREYSFNGFDGWTTECCKLISVEDVRTENYRMPKAKALPKDAKNSAVDAGFESIDIPVDEDVPF